MKRELCIEEAAACVPLCEATSNLALGPNMGTCPLSRHSPFSLLVSILDCSPTVAIDGRVCKSCSLAGARKLGGSERAWLVCVLWESTISVSERQ